MCFSASASFTASAVLGAIGLLCLYKGRYKTKRALPLCLIPVLFSIQQGMEGIVWLSHTMPNLVNFQGISSHGFLIIAICLWPVWFPWSAYILEKSKSRKIILFATGILGSLISIIGACFLVREGGELNVNCHHISYFVFSKYYNDVFSELPWALVHYFTYLFAVVGPLFVSSIKGMWPIGVCIGLGLIISQIFSTCAIGSVWCFFGALSSLLIYFVILRFPHTR